MEIAFYQRTQKKWEWFATMNTAWWVIDMRAELVALRNVCIYHTYSNISNAWLNSWPLTILFSIFSILIYRKIMYMHLHYICYILLVRLAFIPDHCKSFSSWFSIHFFCMTRNNYMTYMLTPLVMLALIKFSDWITMFHC